MSRLQCGTVAAVSQAPYGLALDSHICVFRSVIITIIIIIIIIVIIII